MESTDYKYIDLQSLKEDTFEDKDILKEIMELFIELIDEYTCVLNRELNNKNWFLLFKATHKIKPNISMFGIKELEPIIFQLDRNFKSEQNLDEVDGLVKASLDIFKEVRTEVLHELKTMKNE